jgi:hypothetical protein
MVSQNAIEYVLFVKLSSHSSIAIYPVTALIAFVKITASCS